MMKLFANPMALVMFLSYLVAGITMLALYMQVYMWMTPYDDIAKIRGESPWSTVCFGASMIGFTMPLVSCSLYGASLLDFIAWGVIASLAQLATYQIIRWKIAESPTVHTTESMNGAIVHSTAMLCVGMINAVSLVP